jgi:osmotically-inducible protein OsmY
MVSAMAISVETFNGLVQLSGFAKSPDERLKAETLARNISGVKAVKNDIVVRG